MSLPANSRLLRISSKDRSVESPSKYNIIYRTNNNDLHQVSRVVLKSAIIPNNAYNINIHNNTLNFVNTGSVGPYVIPVGQYTTATLITAIEALITDLTIVQSALTGRLTFTMAANTFDIDPNPVTNPMSTTLGFETVAATVATYTADHQPDLTGLDNVYIESQALSSNTAMISADKLKQSVFCNVGMDVAYGSVKVLEKDLDSLDFSAYHTHKNISSIDIKLVDENSNELDLNGAEWTLIFRVFL